MADAAPSAPRKLGAFDELRRVAAVLSNYKRSVALLLVLLFASGVFQGFGLALIAPLIAFVVGGSGQNFLARAASYGIVLDARQATFVLAACLVVMISIGQALSIWRVSVTTRLNYALARNWQKRIFANLLNEDLVQSRSGRLGARIQLLLQHPLYAAKCVRRYVDLLYQLINLTILSLVLLLHSPWLTLVALGVMSLANMIFVHPMRRSALRDANEMRPVFDDLSSYIAENLGTLMQIKLYGAHEQTWKGWAARLGRYSDLHHRQLQREEIAAAVIPVAMSLFLLVLLFYSLLWSQANPADILATIGLFIVVGTRLQTAFGASQRIWTEIGALQPSLDIVLENSRLLEVKDQGRKIEHNVKRVAFENVTYAYFNEKGVRDLSFVLESGAVSALSGPSGSGKSTTVALLAGLLKPQSGRIMIDDVDLADVAIDSWHRRMAVVMQDAPLFSGSIRDNILIGDPAADDAAMVAAAKRAAVHDTIERLPDGYDTVLAERGQSLSGGQAQRIALARAFIRNPDLLVLDEATNALDEETQGKIIETLHEFAASGGIVLVVTHRPEMIEAVDRTIDIDQKQGDSKLQYELPAVGGV
jgi:ATP-binding cassette subfamily C protein